MNIVHKDNVSQQCIVKENRTILEYRFKARDKANICEGK
jgi:hypothetical protein